MVDDTKMKKNKWIDLLNIVLLIGISVAARMFYIAKYMNGIKVSDGLIQKTWVTDISFLQNIELSLDDIYSALLSYAMLFFGNKAIIGVGVNLALQLLSLIFVYLCIRLISDPLASMVPTLIIALLPMYVTMISTVSSFSLLIFVVIFTVWVIMLIIRLIVKAVYNLSHEKEIEIIEEDLEEEFSVEGMQCISEEELSEEESEIEEKDESIEYMESIYGDADDFTENDILSETEFGEDSHVKDATLYHLDHLETQYSELLNEESSAEEQNDYAQETIENEDIASDEECSDKEENSESDNKNSDLEIDFSHYDIEDMSGMDFFDIE